jgi:hypothetical protein
MNKETDKKFVNYHQLAFLQCDPRSPVSELFKRLPISKFDKSDLAPFSVYNNLRYTFIVNLFKAYDLYDEDFAKHLSRLQSPYVWNIYKQLTEEFLHKTAGM